MGAFVAVLSQNSVMSPQAVRSASTVGAVRQTSSNLTCPLGQMAPPAPLPPQPAKRMIDKARRRRMLPLLTSKQELPREKCPNLGVAVGACQDAGRPRGQPGVRSG